jgi:tRNA dimethylallyltransferase
MRAVVEGRSDLATARAACILATRRYAKRQRTWFRHEADVQWRAADAAAIAAESAAFLHAPRIAKAGVAE